MRVLSASVVVLAAMLSLGGCEGGDKPAGGAASTEQAADIGQLLATVNGVQIGSKEFEQAAARKTPANGESLSIDEKKEVLDGLVEEKLLYAEALRKGLDKDPKVQKVMVNTLVREEVFNTLKNSDFPDDVLQKYYDEHKSEFVVPEKVQVKRILIKVTPERPDADAKKLADSLRGQVSQSPDSFKDVAAQNSEDPYKRRGGDLGFVSKEGKPGLDQSIVDKAFTLEVNQVSDVFKTDEGYNIVMVAARREQIERTFQQMKGTVLRKAKNARQQELYDAYVGKLRTGAKIEVKEDELAKIEIKSSRRPFSPGMGMGEGEEGMDDHGTEAGAEGAEGAEGAADGMPGLKPGGMPPRPQLVPPGGRQGGGEAGGGKARPTPQ